MLCRTPPPTRRPWPTPKQPGERRPGLNVVALPAGWTPETAARARLGATGRRAGGLLNGFCMLLAGTPSTPSVVDEATYPGGYGGRTTGRCGRDARAGVSRSCPACTYFMPRPSPIPSKAPGFKLIARENSRAKWSQGGRVSGATAEAVASFIMARHVAELQYGRRAKALAAAPAAALVTEGGAQLRTGSRTRPPSRQRAAVWRSCSSAPSTWTVADYLDGAGLRLRRLDGAQGQDDGQAINRCHPNVVRRRVAAAAVRAGRARAARGESQAPRRGPPPPPPRRRWTPALYRAANPPPDVFCSSLPVWSSLRSEEGVGWVGVRGG